MTNQMARWVCWRPWFSLPAQYRLDVKNGFASALADDIDTIIWQQSLRLFALMEGSEDEQAMRWR